MYGYWLMVKQEGDSAQKKEYYVKDVPVKRNRHEKEQKSVTGSCAGAQNAVVWRAQGV